MAPKHPKRQTYGNGKGDPEHLLIPPDPEICVPVPPSVEHVSRVHAPFTPGTPAASLPANDSSSSSSSRSHSAALPAPGAREAAPTVSNRVGTPQPTIPGHIAVSPQSLQDLLGCISAQIQQSAHARPVPRVDPPPRLPPAAHNASAPAPPHAPTTPAATNPSPRHLHPATAMRPCHAVITDLMHEQAQHRLAPDWLHTAVIDPATLPRLKILTAPLNVIKAAYAKHYKFVTEPRAATEHPLATSDFLTVLHMNACSLSSQLDRVLALMPRLRRVAPPPGAAPARSRGGAVPAYFEWRRQFIEFLVFVAEALETYFLQRVHHGVLEYRRAVFAICRQLPRPLAAVAAPAVDLFNDNSVPVLDLLAALDYHFCPDPARAEEVCGMSLRVIRSDMKAKRLLRARGDCKIAEILDEFNAACADTLR